MGYETNINIQQYYVGGFYHFQLKVTDTFNNDFYYDGSAPTLEVAINTIQTFLKNHQ